MRKLISYLTRLRYIRIFIQLVQRYLSHDISQQGAALAYYLLFALFPLLIFISSLVVQLHLDFSLIAGTFAPILPAHILALAEDYLHYVSDHLSASTLWFSAIFSVWFPMRATFCLMRAVRYAYNLSEPKNHLRHTFKVLFFTVILLFCVILTLLLIALSQRLVGALARTFSFAQALSRLWGVLRFAALGAVVFVALSALYAAAQDKPRHKRAILPGAALATLAWIVLSFCYSVYAENFSNYATIYGALSTIIVLMIWLYLTALTLSLGAEFNHTILCNSPPPAA